MSKLKHTTHMHTHTHTLHTCTHTNTHTHKHTHTNTHTNTNTHTHTHTQTRTRLISKKGIGIVKSYLNKMKILLMNSITFKIPILTAVILK